MRSLTSNRASRSTRPGGIIGRLIDTGSDTRKSGICGKCLLILIPIKSSLLLWRRMAAFGSLASTSVRCAKRKLLTTLGNQPRYRVNDGSTYSFENAKNASDKLTGVSSATWVDINRFSWSTLSEINPSMCRMFLLLKKGARDSRRTLCKSWSVVVPNPPGTRRLLS